MFHTFQKDADSPTDNRATADELSRSGQHKPFKKVPHACTECKRRKIRCDGAQPCEKCTNRGCAASCFYISHRERVYLSKPKLEEISKSAEEYRTIFERLFPGHDVSSLLSLPRQDLLGLLGIDNQGPTQTSWPPLTCPNSVYYNPEVDTVTQFQMEPEGLIVAQNINADVGWTLDERHLAYYVP